MAELFGTVSPIWSAIPYPGLAWYQTPMAGAGPIGGIPAGIAGPQGPAALGSGMVTGVPSAGPVPGEQYGFSRGIVSAGPAAGFGAGPSNFASTSVSAPFPQFGDPSVAGGVTAPALVAAIAMRRGQPAGPTSDQEIEDFLYDALDLLPGSSEVEIRCDGGRTSLMGAVSQKRLKRDIGEIAWAIPGINDVQNTITIAPRRRARAQARDAESSPVAGRKTA
jgi:hypothetical protein